MSDCPHHKYIADDIEKLEERVIELEKVASTTTTMLTNLCGEIGKLAESIKDLASSFNELQEATISSTIMTKRNEDDIKEVRGWVIGAVSTLIITFLGWIVWWLQTYRG